MLHRILTQNLYHIRDSKNRILFGDGATANLISSEKKNNSFEILNFTVGTDGSGYKNAIIENFGNKNRNFKKKKLETI